MDVYELSPMQLLQYCAREIGFRPAWKYEADAMERLKESRFVKQRADGVWVATEAGNRALDLVGLKPLEEASNSEDAGEQEHKPEENKKGD